MYKSCVQRVATKRGPKGGTKIDRQYPAGSLTNTYIPGSGVGATNIFARRLKKRYAMAKIKTIVEAITSIISAIIGGTSQLLVYNFEAIQNTPSALEIVNDVIRSSETNTRVVIYSAEPFDIQPLVTSNGYNYINSIDIVTSPPLSGPLLDYFIITENEILLSGTTFYTKTIDFEMLIE